MTNKSPDVLKIAFGVLLEIPGVQVDQVELDRVLRGFLWKSGLDASQV